MKKIKLTKITYIFTVCLLSLALAGGLVAIAVAADKGRVFGPLTTPVDYEKTTNLGQRLSQRKLSFKNQLSGIPMQQIVKQCGLAQGVIGKLKTKDNSARLNRTQAYSSLATRLNNIIDNLDNQGTDTSALLEPQKQFYNAINKYLQNAEKYRTAMNDLVIMECASDPVGFKATVLDARSLRVEMANDSTAIKSILPGLVKAVADTKQKIVVPGGNS